MVFKKIVPSTVLLPYVKNFWFFDSEESVVNEEVLLPSGYIQIAFNLGSAEWQSKHGNCFQTDSNLELRGQHITPSITKMIGHDVILGINFHPHTVCYFIDDKATHFSNCVLNLNDVLGKETPFLYEMLLLENDLMKRISILEKFLIKKLYKHRVKEEKIELLDYMVNTLELSATANHTVKQIIDKTGFSERYIQRLFNEYIGISPKALQKIYRFHESLRQLNKSPDTLTPIAYDCGYADQAHFARDFKSFTGTSPSAYRSELFPSGLGFL